MSTIEHFRAFWHPGKDVYGIEIKLQDGRVLRPPITTPVEFVAVLALLNGPHPAMTDEGHIVSQR